MATKTSMPELRKLTLKDLRKEIGSLQSSIGKLRMGMVMKKEKDTARYQKEKRQLARLKTVLTEKQAEELSQTSADTTVSDSKKAKTPTKSKKS